MYKILQKGKLLYQIATKPIWNAQMRYWEIKPGVYLDARKKDIQILASEVSAVDFKMRFNISERVHLGSLRVADAVVKDLYELLDDPRTLDVDVSLQSVQDGVDYCVNLAAVALSYDATTIATRIQEILKWRDVTDGFTA